MGGRCLTCVSPTKEEVVWERGKHGTESGRTVPLPTAKLTYDDFQSTVSLGLVV